MWIADGWQDFEVLDAGSGEKLERWGDVVLRRPDPQVIWPAQAKALWARADAHYLRDASGGGAWKMLRDLPEAWELRYGRLIFGVRPTGFKHTGLFPEQAVNWDWMAGLVKKRAARGEPVRVLNLFAYTGGATLACAAAGAEVVHVDAAKGMVAWARENAERSGLAERPIRYLIDDAVKLAQREIRRGNRYEGIVLDPPSYGRGPDGQVWKLEKEIYGLLEALAGLLSEKPLFFLLNAYTTGLQPRVLANLLELTAARERRGSVFADEIGLPVTQGHAGIVLPCGASGRWEARG